MIRYILNQYKRSMISNTLFCILLALAGALLCLGSGLLAAALSSIEYANDTFTTIAVPNYSAIRRYIDRTIASGSITQFESEYGYVFTTEDPSFTFYLDRKLETDILKNISEKVYTTDTIAVDARRVFGAYSPEIVPYMRPAARINNRPLMMYMPNSTSAFISVAESIESLYFKNYRDDLGWFVLKETQVNFNIEDTLLIHPSYAPQRSIEIRNFGCEMDGSDYVEIGKRYFMLVRDMSQGGRSAPATSNVGDNAVGFDFIQVDEFESYSDIPTDALYVDIQLSEEGCEWPLKVYSRPKNAYHPDPRIRFSRENNEGFRWIIELPDDSSAPLPADLQEEINSIVQMGSISTNSLIVLTVNNLDAFYQFNDKMARITEGRGFSDEEFKSGARVCLVNSLIEGISVGDKIMLQLYDTKLYREDSFNNQNVFWYTLAYSPYTMISEPIEYEVIGLVTAPENELTDHAIPINAVFIPDNSFGGPEFVLPHELTGDFEATLRDSGMTQDEWVREVWMPSDTSYTPLLNTIIVPNGKNDDFLDTVESILPEYSGFFRIYDQGYLIVRNALDTLLRGGTIVFALCIAGWVISALIFALFYILRKRKEAELLYALGVSRKHRFRWLFVQFLIVIIISQCIAFGVSTALNDVALTYAYDMIVTGTEETAEPENGAEDGSDDGAAPGEALTTPEADSDVVEEADETSRAEMRRSPYAIPAAIAGQTLLLLITAGCISGMLVQSRTKTIKQGK